MHGTTFSLEYPSVDEARTVERSLRPEVGDIDGERSEASLSRDGSEVTISLEAEDLIALRAGHNTWLGLATVAERAHDIASRPE